MSAVTVHRPKPTNNRYIPTPEHRSLVAALSATLVPVEEIAKLIINPFTKRGISPVTLRKCFKDELTNGHHKVKAFAVNKLFQAMAAGQVSAIIFYLKSQCGWRTVDREDGMEDEGIIPGTPRAGAPGAGEIIDVTPERIPDDPIAAARMYQQMMSGS